MLQNRVLRRQGQCGGQRHCGSVHVAVGSSRACDRCRNWRLRTLVAASSAKTAGFGVPSSVRKWRTRHDSNV
ncbi:MAG: hypothetical protein CFE30_13465 [Bradyrhizobium sp. PARBB1]|nr:MAG: hypothetical protein CFE30_13465 [Bradyrhizobium sp. PARBB1]